MIRWRRRPSAPIVMSTATFSSNCTAEPQASVQLAYAVDRAMSAAARLPDGGGAAFMVGLDEHRHGFDQG